MKTKAVILVRVSTQKQETARQISELKDYANSQDYEVVSIIEESISGGAKQEDRTGLQEVEKLARAGEIQKVLVHEVSRIARKNSVAHQFIEVLEEEGVSLYWHTQKIETLLEDGQRNPAASIMFALLAEMARNEKETLRARILSGLEEAKKNGKILGRPVGTQTPVEELLEKHGDIVRQLKKGKSQRDIAKIVGKGVSTVKRVKKLMAA